LAAREAVQIEYGEGKGRPRLSVVIPMYNETGRIRDTIPTMLDYFRKQRYRHEFVVVDDGSQDGTADLARELFPPEKTRVLEKRPNRGKGSAVKAGMLAARGEWILFCDADLSTPPEELDRLWEWTNEYEIIIGSRKMEGANIVRHQPLWRESLGKVFTWLTNRLATRGISDVTCGFKLFSHEAAQALFSRSRIRDWSFDAEVLFIAQRRGFRVKEVPVTWHDKPGTKVRIVRDAINALRGLAKIRLNSIKGLYR
jgi:dolichyl-phosphate beta-glucosyltransferase